MKKLQKNKKLIVTILAVIIIVLITVFTINKVTTNSNKGDALAGSSNLVGVTKVTIDKSGTADGTYTINDGGQSISFTATLGAVGDAINYVITVTNTGYSPATVIDSVDITNNDNENIKYVTNADETIINKGESKNIEFKIEYDTDENVSTSNEITVTFNFKKYGLSYGDTIIYPLLKAKQSAKYAGLYPDSTESGRYYYSGSSVNNNIVFNGEPYKILGFEKDGRIKIIKMVSIGSKYWNTAGTNVWAISSLKDYLEETWMPTQESGEDYQYIFNNNEWYVGAVSSDSDIAADYTAEKGTVVNSAVGLISASEFLKSKYIGSTFLNVSGVWWTISPYALNSYNVWTVSSSTLVEKSLIDSGYYIHRYTYEVFPVLYLKSSVSLTGSGTSTDPYCIKGSTCPKDLDFSQRTS